MLVWTSGSTRALSRMFDCQLLERSDPRCTSTNELGMRGVPINSRSERRQIMMEQGLQFGSQKFEDRGKKKHYDQGR